jgi:hypothetical protein
MTASGVHVKLLPPKQVVLSAGTRERGRILSFKLRPFNQITLEGEREFACLLTVPAEWKGDCVLLTCTGKQKGVAGEVARDMKIGLYPDGDDKARQRVEADAKKHDADPERAGRAFVGAWEGTWKHTVNGEGKLDGAISAKGDFTGTFYGLDGKAIGSFKGSVKDGKATFVQTDASGEYIGEGVLGLDKQGRLTATFEHRTKEGRVVGSFKVILTRK